MPSYSNYLSINGIQKRSDLLNLNEVTQLFDDYFNKVKRNLSVNDLKAENNLPTYVMIKRVLNKDGINYKDFIGKYRKNNAKIYNGMTKFEDAVCKYKEFSDKVGHPLTCAELKKYGLPSSEWFLRNCHDIGVNKWLDFVFWCGYIKTNSGSRSGNHISKEKAKELIYKYQDKINRPIKAKDFTVYKIGFSYSTMKQLWGGLNKCKYELGLDLSIHSNNTPIEYYIDGLKKRIEAYKQQSILTNIVLQDLNIQVGDHIKFRNLIKMLRENNVNLYEILKEHELTLQSKEKSFSKIFLFEDNERVTSSYEKRFSTFLRNLGLEYNKDYNRDILYSDLLGYNIDRKINCDYLLFNKIAVEIAGIIYNPKIGWKNISFNMNSKNGIIRYKYHKKLLLKDKLLLDNEIPHLILFNNDFKEDKYKSVFIRFLKEYKAIIPQSHQKIIENS